MSSAEAGRSEGPLARITKGNTKARLKVRIVMLSAKILFEAEAGGKAWQNHDKLRALPRPHATDAGSADAGLGSPVCDWHRHRYIMGHSIPHRFRPARIAMQQAVK